MKVSCTKYLLAMVCAAVVCAAQSVRAGGASDLRLVPFPKEVLLEGETFQLNRRLALEISQSEAAILGEQISAELIAAGFEAPVVHPIKTAWHVLRLATKPRRTVKKLLLPEGATPEDYVLLVQTNAVTVGAAGTPGLFYATQTLRQLIRANRQDCAIPCLRIRDWPSLGWRAFQDDLTRGPSSTLTNLREQAGLGAFLKLNIFTYYMEDQFAFQKHPGIGPKDGSLTPDELKALVAYAEPLHLNVMGNQQSFGHFTSILAHPEYAALRETPYLLCPTNAQTYRLLDDLYSEVAPLLPFPFFNVCCDETEGLGEGPSKPLVQKIGAGAVYVQHLCRLHDLLRDRYNKRMMMWGDIILRHPEHLSAIPKDTIMLTWGYDPRPSFDDQIVPFAKAGYQFFVCPGVNCWNRVLPNFGAATTNIQNFVRDGIRRGAIGMLNTAWDDDGENFNAPNWHGFAWGAECAWNASATAPRDFNRRIGAVLFGEKGDQFGRAIEALNASGLDGLANSVFWQFTFSALKVRTADSARVSWEQALGRVRAARAYFEGCQREAGVNAGLLDYFIFGTRRMELYLERELNRLEAALLYRNARRLPLAQALPLLEKAEAMLRSDRDTHEQLAQRFEELWRRENKPYALDRTLRKYRDLLGRYDAQLDRLSQARRSSKPDRSLPTPREVGLELLEEGR